MIAAVVAVTVGSVLIWTGPMPKGVTDQSRGANAPSAKEKATPATEAERLSRLQRSIETDEKAMQSLQEALDAPEGEYRTAEAEFKKIDATIAEITKTMQTLEKERKLKEAAQLQAEIKELREKWSASKQRFNLAIEMRRTQQEKLATLQKKVQRDRQELDRLTNAPAKKPEEKTAAKTGDAPAPVTTTDKPAATTPAKPANGEAKAENKPATPPGEPAKSSANRQELLEAEKQVSSRQEEAEKAKQTVEALNERIESIRHDLEIEHKLLETARKKLELASQDKSALINQLHQVLTRPHGDAETANLEIKINEADQRVEAMLAEKRAGTDRIQDLQLELASLQVELLTASQESDKKQVEAERARQQLNWLASPIHPHNLLRWALQNGPKILAIVVGMVLLNSLMRLLGRRVVRGMANKCKRGSVHERQNRAETLVSVFQSAATLSIFGGGLLMLLESVGIPVVPLLGGAAVFGLAVAFGAQNLIRDYFAGFMVLLEDQYSINDVVQIGDVSGLVEKITLRMTVLRDLSGVAHFVPHGTISRVSNMTHGWSRALFDVGVAYKEDVNRVMALLLELGKELRQDPVLGEQILEDPEMLGVDSFAESAIVIKFFIKTKPLKQWLVKRELLRRIKVRFDELGIEIPLPHRTVYHRYEGLSEQASPRVVA